MRSCFEITALASAELDRSLKKMEKIELTLHTAMCPHCKNFRKNIQFIHKATSQYGKEDLKSS